MKRISALLLALVMLLSLCACSNNQATDPSNSNQAATNSTAASTGNTENPTDGTEGTTGTTEAPTEEPTTAPTEEPTTPPTQAPTTPPETQPAACSHSWKTATCTAPQTCTKCGVTQGNAAGHSWSNATCTAPKTCSKCGTTEGVAAGHSWNAATCIAPKTCKACGITEGTKGDHTYTNGVCSVCGATSVLNPNTHLTNDEYLGTFYVAGEELIFNAIQPYGEVLLVLDRIFTSEPEDDLEYLGTPIVYQGISYYSAGAGQNPYHYELTDTEILVKGVYWDNDDPDTVTIKLILQSDGKLKVTYSTNEKFPVGTILSTNPYDVLK